MDSRNSYSLPVRSDLSGSMAAFFLCILVMAGIWTRLSGLAERQVAQDEYYFIKSVQNIMEFGVPRYPDGGYYLRGILPQYLTALCSFLFGSGGFAYRLPSALLGLGTIVMTYFLGRQFLDRSWSIVLAAILTFSSWEVEFSRFARMYAPFQFVAVCFFWSLYRYSFNELSGRRYLAVVFAVIGLLTHELGIFVAIFLFLPVLAWFNGDWRKLRGQSIYIVVSILVLLVGVFLVKYPFRFVGVSNHLPDDFVEQVTRIPQWLAFGSGVFGKTWFLLIAALIVACIAGWYVRYAFRNSLSADVEDQVLGALLAVAACCAVYHQFAMCIVIMFVVVLRKPKVVLKKPYVYFLLLLFAIAFFWLMLLLFSKPLTSANGLVSMVTAYKRSIREYFFAFPDLYLPVINEWADTVPVLGFCLGLAVVYQVARIRKSSLEIIAKNPVIPVLVIFVLMGVQPPQFYETRYVYFLYPLALCVALLSAGQLAGLMRRFFEKLEMAPKLLMIFVCLIAFSLSEDFDIFHLSHINSDTVAFRTGKYERLSSHWYQRWDFQRPAEFLDKAISDGDTVIVSSDVDTMCFYLTKKYTIHYPRDAADYEVVSRARGTRELWSGKPMLSSNREILDLTKKSSRVWLALYPGWGSLKLDPEALWPGRIRDIQVYKPGRDKRAEIWKIELKQI